MDWNLARAFCATAEHGSLSAAARRLGLTQPTLSRQIAALETGLGVMLFERLGKRLAITEAGLSLLEPARAMAAAAEAMTLAAAGTAREIAGPVSISATDAVSAYLLPDLLLRLRREAPQITFVIVATNAVSDLRRREADIAIRHVRPHEPDLIARQVGEIRAYFYAAESWLAANPAPGSPADLAEGALLGFEPASEFTRILAAAGLDIPADRLRILSGSAAVLWEMVRAGHGVGLMLEAVAARTPGVTRLFPEWPGFPTPLWLVCHRELRTSRRVRLVFDMLAEELERLAAGAGTDAGLGYIATGRPTPASG